MDSTTRASSDLKIWGGQVVGTGALGGALKEKARREKCSHAMILIPGSWSGVAKHSSTVNLPV